ncbi:MAG: CPBP family intramembrane glutamic endopeptidase [bacterium]
MLRKYIESIASEIKKEPSPLFPAGVLLISVITLTMTVDKRLISFLSPLIPAVPYLKALTPYYIICFFLLFVIPCVFLKINGKKLGDFGLTFGKLETALPLFMVFFVSLTVIAYITSKISSVGNFYSASAAADPKEILVLFISEFLLMWSWEFMFRGFMVQGLRDYTGGLSIFIQLIPYVLLHFNKPQSELYASVIFGIFFGYFAYTTRSFVYLVFLHAYYSTLVCVLI